MPRVFSISLPPRSTPRNVNSFRISRYTQKNTSGSYRGDFLTRIDWALVNHKPMSHFNGIGSAISGPLQEFDQHRLSGTRYQNRVGGRGRGRLLQPNHPGPINGFAHIGPGTGHIIYLVVVVVVVVYLRSD